MARLLISTFHASLLAVPPNPTTPTAPNPAWKLPLTGLGPFGPTSKCAVDAWPSGHCTLNTGVNNAAPVFYDAAPGMRRKNCLQERWAVHLAVHLVRSSPSSN